MLSRQSTRRGVCQWPSSTAGFWWISGDPIRFMSCITYSGLDVSIRMVQCANFYVQLYYQSNWCISHYCVLGVSDKPKTQTNWKSISQIRWERKGLWTHKNEKGSISNFGILFLYKVLSKNTHHHLSRSDQQPINNNLFYKKNKCNTMQTLGVSLVHA